MTLIVPSSSRRADHENTSVDVYDADCFVLFERLEINYIVFKTSFNARENYLQIVLRL